VNAVRIIYASARADFLERVRRYSFLVTLGFALYFGYLAAAGKFTLRIGDSRGIYNSAWIGSLLAIVGSTFISLAGFYFVKNSVQRDRESRVGQILAATPLSRTAYIFSKFASNFAVLSAMIGILALSSLAMQWSVGEDRHMHLWQLLSPFLLLSLPAMAVIAALAVLFETIPLLRGGFGNIAYFFLWTVLLAAPVATGSLAFDLAGLALLRHDLIASSAAPSAENSFSFSLEFGQTHAATAAFRWEGIPWTANVVVPRMALSAAAFLLCGLAAALFDRFDTARNGRPAPSTTPAPPVAHSESSSSPTAAFPRALTPLAASPQRSRFFAIFSAELRLLFKGQRWWWYTVAAGLLIASATVPSRDARGIILACAWIWPILLWSPSGIRETLHQTNQIIFSAPHPVARQLPAVWLAGAIVTVCTGSGFALRLLLSADWRGLLAWCAGVLFIPSSALAFGVWSGSSKPFEILYTLFWYIGPMHAMPAFDFMGSAPATSSTRYPLFYLVLALVFLLMAVAGRKRQLLV
jgi:hypothetical protein